MPELYSGSHEADVVGRGAVGLTAALALAGGGISTILAGKPPPNLDNRTTPLLIGSFPTRGKLRGCTVCDARAAPIKVMRIVDDTGRLWRAPEVKFQAGEIALNAFGYNIENRYLIDALEQRARNLSGLQIINEDVLSIIPHRQTAS